MPAGGSAQWLMVCAAPRYYEELRNRSIGKFACIVCTAFVIVALVYSAVAVRARGGGGGGGQRAMCVCSVRWVAEARAGQVGGYLTFGAATEGDVLMNYAGARSAVSLSISLTRER